MSEINSATKVNAPKPLSRALKLFFGVGDMCFNLMTNVETYYFNFFLTDVAKFAPALTMAITSTASMIDMALSWVYGAFLTALPAKKWGRYRSWLIMVPWIVPFIYAFQFTKIGSDNTAAVIIVAATVLSHILWNVAYVANVTLVSVVGRSTEGKASMASTRSAYTGLAGVLFSYIGLPVISVMAAVVGQTNRFAAGAFVLGCIFVLGYFAHFKMAAGYEDEETSATAPAAVQRYKVSVPDMFRALFQNSQLLSVIVSFMLWSTSNFVFSAAAVYYWKVTNSSPLQALFITFSAIVGFFGSLLFRPMAVKFSTRTTMMIGCFGTGICFLAFYLFYATPVAILALAVIGKLFMSLSYAASPVLYADTIIYATWKTGKNAAGWIMGLLNLPIKIGVFLRGLVLTAALTAVGYSSNITPAMYTPALQRGLSVVFGVVPGLIVIGSGLAILIGYKLTTEKLAFYQAEIDKKAQ